MENTNINNLIKNFKMFCGALEGIYEIDIFPKCRKRDFVIELNYLEGQGKIEKLGINVVSDSGDVTSFHLKEVSTLSVQRMSEEDESGLFRYYSLIIDTDKGSIKLKKDIRKNVLIFEYETKDVQYYSTIIL